MLLIEFGDLRRRICPRRRVEDLLGVLVGSPTLSLQRGFGIGAAQLGHRRNPGADPAGRVAPDGSCPPSPAEAVQMALDFFLDDGGHVLAGGDRVGGAVGSRGSRALFDRDRGDESWSMVF